MIGCQNTRPLSLLELDLNLTLKQKIDNLQKEKERNPSQGGDILD